MLDEQSNTDLKNSRSEQARMPFWPAAVDDAGLDVYTSRLLAHVIRAAGKSGEYYESRPKAATTCGMSARRVHTALSELVRMSVLAVKDAPSKGRMPTKYALLPVAEWKLNRAPHTRLNRAPETRSEASTVHGREVQPCTHEQVNRAPRANRRFSIRQGTQTEKVLNGSLPAHGGDTTTTLSSLPSMNAENRSTTAPDTAIAEATSSAIEIMAPGAWPSTWIPVLLDLWSPHGEIKPGRIGNALEPLRRRHPFEDVKRSLRAYLLAGNARYGPEAFARAAGDWINGQTGSTTGKGQRTDDFVRRVMASGGRTR